MQKLKHRFTVVFALQKMEKMETLTVNYSWFLFIIIIIFFLLLLLWVLLLCLFVLFCFEKLSGITYRIKHDLHIKCQAAHLGVSDNEYKWQ